MENDLNASPEDKVLILGISGSNRKAGTEYCVKQALRAAEESISGTITRYLSLKGKKISFCIHCDRCIKERCLCTVKDDFQEIQGAFLEADGYIIGTPVYNMNCTPLLQAFFSRLRPLFLVHPGIVANRVGGAIAVGGTRHGGQESAILAIRNFYLTFEILVTGGPSDNYGGAAVWSRDRAEEGVIEDAIGMEKVVGLGRRIAEVAWVLKKGKEGLSNQVYRNAHK